MNHTDMAFEETRKVMRISRSFRVLWCVFAAALLLLAVKAITTPCDEPCSDGAQKCECICVCHSATMTLPANDVVSAVSVLLYAVESESPLYFFQLTTDIFRPPIA